MPSTATRPGALQSWLQPPGSKSSLAKRKRGNISEDEDANDLVSDDESELQVPAKKTQKKAPTKPKTAAKPKATTKSGDSAKEAKKLYTYKLKAVETQCLKLDKKVKAMERNSRSITVDNYAENAADHVGIAQKLIDMSAHILAFNFAMALGDASHRSITSHRMSGESGECCDPYVRLDEALVAAIKAREPPTAEAYLTEDALASVPHRFTESDADVGELKTGRPNKQQRGWIANAFTEWESSRRLARRERRESCADWVRVALDDLLADRKYLDDHGIGVEFRWGSFAQDRVDENVYFRESIKKLQEMVATWEV